MLSRRNGIIGERFFRSGLSLLITASLIISGTLSYGVTGMATADDNQTTEATADTSEEATDNEITDASVSKAREDAADAERKKNAAQEILNSLKSAKENIEDYVVQLDKSLNELQIEISHLEQEQKELEASIKEREEQLEVARQAWSERYSAMKQRIQMVYESGNKRYLDVLLTATSMTDMLNKTEYASQVSSYDYDILTELKKTKEQVANLKQKLDKDLATNEVTQEKVKAQKETMETLVEEKSRQIREYEASIAGQREEVNKYAQAQAEAEAIIAAAEQSASTSATSTYTGGIFTWPVPGRSPADITSPFGDRNSPTPGASTNHKGIDIACDTGDPIVAAAAGTVIVATYNYAEGNYVCIDHGGGVVTLYMHNSQLYVSVGETVTAGQTIAAAGSTGYSTGPHCHFGVRVDGTYVNPMIYLQ
ncbi:MAG: peptidoglycan DD-metalloendopeptidase family protein [Lachnospiraceae bacterium]|nr:peptidoglycan DD-metalloendopeptidase family protein [Lachnospiraceae bacterium]